MNPVNSLGRAWKRPFLLDRIGQVLDSGKYSEGQFVSKFEQLLAFQTKTEHAMALNSCGSALLAVYRHLSNRGVRRIAVQNNTFYATAACAQLANLEVVVIDSAGHCPSMGYESLKAAHEKVGFEAVALTHVGGMLAEDYEDIASFCRKKGLILIEDCAHAYGVQEGEVYPGKYGLAAVWSFYPTKSVPVGEGGAVTTNDRELAEYVQQFRNYGKRMVDGVIKYDQMCLNLRMDEISAAIGTLQLENLSVILSDRERDARALGAFISPMFNRPTNLYKYIVAKHEGWRTVGKVYALSDQVRTAVKNVRLPVDLTYSEAWADSHMCLPIGEGMYDSLTEAEIHDYLRVS